MKSDQELEDGIRHVDHWVILKVLDEDEVFYRLLSSTDEDLFDRWRLNSGIVNFITEQGQVDFHGNSGSVYRCRLEYERLNSMMLDLLEHWQRQSNTPGRSISTIGFAQFVKEWNIHKPKWN